MTRGPRPTTYLPSRRPLAKPAAKTSGLDPFSKFLVTAALLGLGFMFAIPLMTPKRPTP